MLLPDGVEWAATFCRLALDKRGSQALDQMQATTLQYINWYSHGGEGGTREQSRPCEFG